MIPFISGIFTAIKSKAVIMAVIGFVLAIVAVFGYIFYKDFKTGIANQAKQEEAIKLQNLAIEKLMKDIKIQAEINESRLKENKELLKKFNSLENKFNKFSTVTGQRDLGELSIARPRIVEKIVTKATKEANRCFEILLGASLTSEEINAERKSEFNSICPELANPNYAGFKPAH